jgi:hypothetical protein
MYAIFHLERIGPSPNATSEERTNAPVTFPRTVKTAIRRPHAMALAIIKRTLGPGAKIMIIAATMYSIRRDGITMR